MEQEPCLGLYDYPPQKRRTAWVGAVSMLFLIAALSLADCRATRRETVATPVERVAVRLKWLHQAQFAGFYCAKELGFYRQNGLDVALERGGAPDPTSPLPSPAIQMVSSGSEDFGVAGADQILLARDKGIPLVAVAVIYRKSPVCYFALKRSGITRPQDFVGKRVAVRLGGNEEVTYRAMMKKAGVDTRKVAEVPVKYDMTPLFTGRVMAWPGYSINEPIVAQEEGYEVNLIWPSDYGVSLYADTLFTTEKMIKDKPDLVKRFVAATLEGWAYAIDHQEEAVKFTLKQSDTLKEAHERTMMKASVELLKPDDKPIGWMDASKWHELQDLLLEAGFLKSRQDVTNAFTTQFLDGP